MYAGPPGRSSFETRYEILDTKTGLLYALGKAQVVWVDHEQGRSMPAPPGDPRALAAFPGSIRGSGLDSRNVGYKRLASP